MFSTTALQIKYIHGSEGTSHYLALDPSYKNPADTSETQGLIHLEVDLGHIKILFRVKTFHRCRRNLEWTDDVEN